MLLRPFLNDATSCASYLFGCGTQAKLAVVDPHAELVDDYLATAATLGAPIVASSRHTCKQTTSPACPNSSRARAHRAPEARSRRRAKMRRPRLRRARPRGR